MSGETRNDETEPNMEDVPLEEILKRVLRTLRTTKQTGEASSYG
jgi:hypothetical protein